MADSDEEEMAALRASRAGGRTVGPAPPAGSKAQAGAKKPATEDDDDSDCDLLRERRLAATHAQARNFGPQPTVPKSASPTQNAAEAPEDSDDAMSVEAAEPVEGMRGFLPMSFGKKAKQKQTLGPDVHLGTRRKDAGGAKALVVEARRNGVQFGPRVMEAAAATGANVRAARAEAERQIRERNAGGAAAKGDEDGDQDEAMPAAAEAEPMEEDDEVPLPGKEKDVIPVTHEVSIQSFSKSITALATDPKSARMVVGCMDGTCKFYDFHGMSEETKHSFRELEPVESHAVRATSFNCSGGVLLVCSSDSHARLFDRDGSPKPIQTTVKGDMYVRDMQHTQGHTQMLTDGLCHPLQPEIFATSSLDGTLRLWDINAKPVGMDQVLPSIFVLKCVDKRNVCIGGGSGRGGGMHPTCVVYSPTDGKKIVGGCTDGSIQMFFEKPRYQKADRILRAGHTAPITSIAFQCEGSKSDIMVTRSMDGTMKIWDCRMLSDAKGPVKAFENLPAAHEKTGVCVSPDGKYIVTGTSFQKGAMDNSTLRVYDGKSFEQLKSLNFAKRSVSRIVWPRDINQLIVGTNVGEVVMLYSPFSSAKGCLHFVGRKAKTKSALDFVGKPAEESAPIFNMTDPAEIQKFWTTGHGNMTAIRRFEARETQKHMTPQRPNTIIEEQDKGGSFVAAVLKAGAKRLTPVESNPQKALLAQEDKPKKLQDPLFDRAYQNSGEKLLDYTTEESEGDKRMRERLKGDFCRKCGMKICRCVDYSTWNQAKRPAPPPSRAVGEPPAQKPKTK